MARKARGAHCPPNLLDADKFGLQVKLALRGRAVTIQALATELGVSRHYIAGAINGNPGMQVQEFLRLRAWLKKPSEAPRTAANKKGYPDSGKTFDGAPASNMGRQMAFDLITPPPWNATHAKWSLPRCRSKRKR
jgi:hypothetical protein